MSEEKAVNCPWCEKQARVAPKKETSNYGDIIVRCCSECGCVVSSYLEEAEIVLEKVRTFQDC